MIIDKKSGKQVHAGDTLIRKDYKGFKHRYEVLEIVMPHSVSVRWLDRGDRWVHMTMPLASLQLEEVMI